ncbi:hypothetical protein [Lacinutrix sp.]|uniref:hypothetical protein n=1 Tax=Lacinutrix sp. TaxID=1937692 RepID=UPI0025C59337|nr:hypothetical protein [Lacinutrix sp.]
MKTILKTLILTVFLTLAFNCSDDDDGTTTTGNTQEYFKYTIDGVERIFDFEVEGHFETDATTIDKFEINASGEQPSGSLRRIAAAFTFDNTAFMPSTTYNWGIAQDSNTTEKFYFAESTSTNLFILTADFSAHPIVATVIPPNPVNVGEYLEFTFTGTFQDGNNVTRSIDGLCRVQRGMDQ